MTPTPEDVYQLRLFLMDHLGDPEQMNCKGLDWTYAYLKEQGVADEEAVVLADEYCHAAEGCCCDCEFLLNAPDEFFDRVEKEREGQ